MCTYAFLKCFSCLNKSTEFPKIIEFYFSILNLAISHCVIRKISLFDFINLIHKQKKKRQKKKAIYYFN